MKPMPNVWTTWDVLVLLDTRPEFTERALMQMYHRQTPDERLAGATAHRNGMGFNGVDAPFMTSVAEGYKRYGRLTPRQRAAVARVLRRYVGQLAEVARAHGKPVPPAVRAEAEVRRAAAEAAA